MKFVVASVALLVASSVKAPETLSEKVKNWTAGFQSGFTVLAICADGWWTWSRFARQGEKYAFIEFTADIAFIGKHRGQWIVELTSQIENKGKVQQRIAEFGFELDALCRQDSVQGNPEFGGQLFFPKT
jgi:hypothetical protein